MTVTETSPAGFLELCAETWGEVSLEFCAGVKKAILGESIAGSGCANEVVEGYESYHLFSQEWDIIPQDVILKWFVMKERFLA